MKILDHSDRKEVYAVNGTFMLRQGILIEKQNDKIYRYPLYNNNWQPFNSNCFGVLAGRVGETIPVDHPAIMSAMYELHRTGKVSIWSVLLDIEDAGLKVTDINPVTGKKFSNTIPLEIYRKDKNYVISFLHESAYWIPDTTFSSAFFKSGIEQVADYISDYGVQFHNHELHISLSTPDNKALKVDESVVKEIEDSINKIIIDKIEKYEEPNEPDYV